jgi:uncharacterized surface protein with fasciclin (FAS1) repeats
MSNHTRTYLLTALLIAGCRQTDAPAASAAEPAAPRVEPAPVAPTPAPAELPPLDPSNIVSLAVASKDHTTLVTALKAADYVIAVSNPGPLTVFAPTNAAFGKLPPGTVEGLLKPEKQDALKEVLKYHVTTSAYQVSDLKDGQLLAMANGLKATIHIKDGKMMINDANVVTSIKGSNGMLHIIDAVLTPPAK